MAAFLECSAALDVEVAAFELIMADQWVGNAAQVFAKLCSATKELSEVRGKVQRIASEAI